MGRESKYKISYLGKFLRDQVSVVVDVCCIDRARLEQLPQKHYNFRPTHGTNQVAEFAFRKSCTQIQIVQDLDGSLELVSTLLCNVPFGGTYQSNWGG